MLGIRAIATYHLLIGTILQEKVVVHSLQEPYDLVDEIYNFLDRAREIMRENPMHTGVAFYALFHDIKKYHKDFVSLIERIRNEGYVTIELKKYPIDASIKYSIKEQNEMSNQDKCANSINFGNKVLAHLLRIDSDIRFLLSELKIFSPDLKDEIIEVDNEERILRQIDQKTDRRYKKPFTTIEQLRAIKDFAPELWERLEKGASKKLKGEMLHLITGRSGDECYKKGFTNDSVIDGMTEHIDKHKKLISDLSECNQKSSGH